MRSTRLPLRWFLFYPLTYGKLGSKEVAALMSLFESAPALLWQQKLFLKDELCGFFYC